MCRRQTIARTVVRNFDFMSRKRVSLVIFLLFIIEFVIMTLWFYLVQPETKSGVDVFMVVPILFVLNLLIGLIFFKIKKPIGLVFLGNSIFCPLLFFAIWIMWFTYWST